MVVNQEGNTDLLFSIKRHSRLSTRGTWGPCSAVGQVLVKSGVHLEWKSCVRTGIHRRGRKGTCEGSYKFSLPIRTFEVFFPQMPPLKTQWKQRFWFLPYPHPTSPICLEQNTGRPWIITVDCLNLICNSSHSCCSRCGLFTGTSKHTPWYLVIDVFDFFFLYICQ